MRGSSDSSVAHIFIRITRVDNEDGWVLIDVTSDIHIGFGPHVSTIEPFSDEAVTRGRFIGKKVQERCNTLRDCGAALANAPLCSDRREEGGDR